MYRYKYKYACIEQEAQSTLKLRYRYSTSALQYSCTQQGRYDQNSTGISPRKERTDFPFAQRSVHEQRKKSDPTDKFQIRNLPQLFITDTLHEERRFERDPREKHLYTRTPLESMANPWLRETFVIPGCCIPLGVLESPSPRKSIPNFNKSKKRSIWLLSRSKLKSV